MGDPIRKDNKNIDYLESRYLYESRQLIYIANEETNQVFDKTDIPDFIEAWKGGQTFEQMAEFFGHDKWELYLLAIDLIKEGKIDGDIKFDRSAADV